VLRHHLQGSLDDGGAFHLAAAGTKGVDDKGAGSLRAHKLAALVIRLLSVANQMSVCIAGGTMILLWFAT
jgi:hypothetical protein